MEIKKDPAAHNILYPVMLDLKGKKCVVIGGGKIAFQKLQTLVLTGAVIHVITLEADSDIQALAREGFITMDIKAYDEADLLGAYIVFGATNQRDVNEKIYQDAQKVNSLVNIVDTPDLCQFQVPASVKRGDLIISISTSGKSPALAKKIRKDLEQQYSQEYILLLQWLDQWRMKMKRHPQLTQKDREIIFNKVVQYPLIEWIKNNSEGAANKQFNLIMGQIVRQYFKK